VPAILLNTSYIEIVITLMPARPKRPVAADEDLSLEKTTYSIKTAQKSRTQKA
jgi:hypothetical protein